MPKHYVRVTILNKNHQNHVYLYRNHHFHQDDCEAMHLSPISRHLELVSWGEARNKGEKWNVVIIFLPFLKVERCCYFNAMYFLFILFSRCADDEIDKEE